MRWILSLLALALGAMVAACGSGVPQEAVDPYANRGGGGATATPDGEASAAPTVDLSSLSLVGDEERRMLGTLVADAERRGIVGGTPGPGASAGGVSVVPRVGATPVVTVVAAGGTAGGQTPVPRVGVVAGATPVAVATATPVVGAQYTYELAPCEEDFREMLARDRGLVGRWFEMHPRTLAGLLREREGGFDVDYVAALNEGFEASRPDCVAAGWAPEFSYGAECEGFTFRGVDITSGGFLGKFQGASISGRTRQGAFVWNPTHQEADLVLIQFSRLPMSEDAGCWVGDIVSGRWGWQTADGSAHGGMYPSSAVCNGNLLIRAELLYESSWDSAEWLSGVERYLRENRELCPRARLSPVLEAAPGCPETGPAGPFEGGVVVHWDFTRVFDGMPVCWVGNVDPNDGGLVWSAYDERGAQVVLRVPGG